ncbi:hypothetical protein ACFT2C_08745 [Promicromonospora sp. NPDC057138]|uniref:hypothetical protein n=1 Tax=Promicromonospora sp. NPDC057138 TaxID=3346031 RepID=UPI003639795E
MKKMLAASALAVAATFLIAPSASATIHPIVESADCANSRANEVHPLGDVAEPPGQTPGQNHSETSTLRALQEAIDTPAAFGHKLNGICGP